MLTAGFRFDTVSAPFLPTYVNIYAGRSSINGGIICPEQEDATKKNRLVVTHDFSLKQIT
jgi:hypothetical protein